MKRITWRRQNVFFWMFLALAALGLGQVLGLVLNSESAATIQEEEISQSLILTGEVLLEEEPVRAPSAGIWTQTSPEGKVSGGQTLFTGPVATADISNEVRLLSGAVAAGDMTRPRRREELHKAISGLTGGESDVIDLMALVLEDASRQQLIEAQSRLAALAGQCETITAPVGGIFIPETEGLCLGRIITSEEWKITLELPFAVQPGDKITVELLSGIFREAQLTAESAAFTDQGCQVLFSCGQELPAVAKIRNISVKIFTE